MQWHHWSTRGRPRLNMPQVSWQGAAHEQQTNDSSGCWRHHAWSGGYFLLPMSLVKHRWGCDNAIAARWCMAWGKFRKVLPILTNRWPTTHLRYAVRYPWPVSIRLCFMVLKLADRALLTCSGSVSMTTQWYIGSVRPKTKTKHALLHYNKLALMILRQS